MLFYLFFAMIVVSSKYNKIIVSIQIFIYYNKRYVYFAINIVYLN